MSDDTTYVANSARAWGTGDTADKALARLAEHWHGDVPDTVSVTIVEVSGFNGMERRPTRSWVDADEVHDETEYEIPKDAFTRLTDAMLEVTLAVEECLVDNEAEDDNEAEAEAAD